MSHMEGTKQLQIFEARKTLDQTQQNYDIQLRFHLRNREEGTQRVIEKQYSKRKKGKMDA